MVESLHLHVQENFQKQTPSIQEMLRIRLYRLRVALCSIIPSGRQRAAECRALLTFYSIYYVLRTIVRPKSATAQEKVSCCCCCWSCLTSDSHKWYRRKKKKKSELWPSFILYIFYNCIQPRDEFLFLVSYEHHLLMFLQWLTAGLCLHLLRILMLCA